MNVGLTITAGDTWARESFCRLKYLWVLQCCMQSANTWLESPQKRWCSIFYMGKILHWQAHLWFQIIYYSAVAIWSFILTLLAIIHLSPDVSISVFQNTLHFDKSVHDEGTFIFQNWSVIIFLSPMRITGQCKHCTKW